MTDKNMTDRNMNNKITKEHYFKNKSGFLNPEIIKFDELNIKAEIYYNNIKNKLNTIPGELNEIITHFKKLAGLPEFNTEKTLKIYIFNDREDYQNLGNKFKFGTGDEGGRFDPTTNTIYVYQQGNIHNLKHEFVHALAHHAGYAMPHVLSEGIAECLQYHDVEKFTSQGHSIDSTQLAGLNLQEILALDYSDDGLIYQAGHALVMYLQEKEPELIKKYLMTLRENDADTSEKLLTAIKDKNDDFKNWLDSKNTVTAMKAINALQVTRGDFIGTKKEIIGNEIKDISYYKAEIKTMDGKDAGIFSATEHYSFYGYFRSYNGATNDYMDIPKEYNTLKVIKDNNKDYKLIYSDNNGNAYKDSSNYKEQSKFILSKYSDKAVAEKILTDLTYIDPRLIITLTKTTEDIELSEGTTFTIKGLGSGDFSALSLFNNKNEKIGELLSESGYFRQISGETEDYFIFSDTLYNVSSSYKGGAYLAVTEITEKNGQYKTSFIDGRPVNSDAYFNQPHLHENELLNPSISHLNKDLSQLLLKNNIKTLSHKDSALAKYSDEKKRNDYILEKAELLDTKGSDRTDDDVHQAMVTLKGAKIYTFKNMGFYITEERRDSEGHVINNGNLFIHDHGKNIRYQLPNDITHLKLVKKDGLWKLAPADKNGHEFKFTHDDYKNMHDEHKYIDPVFVHRYEKRDYAHQHVNIGLTDFSNYSENTLFMLKYDKEDYHIKKDANGQVLRINDQSYMTKVRLYESKQDNSGAYSKTGDEIGMLSNNFHNFKGEIFFSVDYNYSYNDFLASVSPNVMLEKQNNKIIKENEKKEIADVKITFDQSEGDIGDTNRGYTDYQQFFEKQQQIEIVKKQEVASHEIVSDKSEHDKDISINYDDIYKLYDNLKGYAGKKVVSGLWRKIHDTDYKISHADLTPLDHKIAHYAEGFSASNNSNDIVNDINSFTDEYIQEHSIFG